MKKLTILSILAIALVLAFAGQSQAQCYGGVGSNVVIGGGYGGGFGSNVIVGNAGYGSNFNFNAGLNYGYNASGFNANTGLFFVRVGNGGHFARNRFGQEVFIANTGLGGQALIVGQPGFHNNAFVIRNNPSITVVNGRTEVIQVGNRLIVVKK